MIASDTLLVIPTCRDGAELAAYLPKLCAQMAFGPDDVLVQVVDDGSPPDEQAWLAAEIERLRRAYDFLQPLMALPVNRGKGYAIRAGWGAHDSMRWLAFVDADGAVPAEEVASLLQLAKNHPASAMYIAMRSDLPETTVKRFWHRRLGSWFFNAWVRLCLPLEMSDTQCGLKIIPAAFFAENVSPCGGPFSRRAAVCQETDPPSKPLSLWREDGFAFDLELLLRARAVDLPVIAQPISWNEHAGSSLGAGAMLGLFVAVWRLRKG
jgi:hypothetical protein